MDQLEEEDLDSPPPLHGTIDPQERSKLHPLPLLPSLSFFNFFMLLLVNHRTLVLLFFHSEDSSVISSVDDIASSPPSLSATPPLTSEMMPSPFLSRLFAAG
jgi:hypothetical protein